MLFAKLKKLIYFIILINLSYTIYSKNNFQIQSPPSWIENISYKTNSNFKINAGYYYLLIDKQEQVSQHYKFNHYAIKINNNSGVQQMSDIEFNYDPKYQQLIIHNISINRDGNIINKLVKNNIKFLQREPELNSFVYSGKETAYINLTDIRTGDIIDYSYSIIGQNPIYKNKIFGNVYFEYSVPINKINFSLIIPKEREVNFKAFNGCELPIITNLNSTNKLYRIQKENIQAKECDNNLPSWYDPYSYINYSEIKNLKELINWSLELFKVNQNELLELKKVVKKQFGEGIDEAKIIKIIRFVQDEIRYLSNNDGINSHKPDSPLNVFKKRFGDCKSKSLLLVEILRMYGIEASPVLLNTSSGKTIKDQLPSPDLFNHCITYINFNKSPYYIDPTITDQGGNLDNIYIPYYKNVLIIDENFNQFIDVLFRNNTSTKVIETFIIEGKDAILKVNTRYTNKDADFQRSSFKDMELYEITKNYEEFYSDSYPSIKSIKDIEIIDKRDIENYIEVNEMYSIENILEDSDNKLYYNLSVSAMSLNYYVNIIKSPKRTMPYDLSFPLNYEHKTKIMCRVANAESENIVYNSNAFGFTYDIKKLDNYLEIYYNYTIKLPYLDAKSVNTYFSDHDKILKLMSHNIPILKSYADNPKQYSSNSNTNITVTDGINYFAIFVTIVLFLIFLKYSIHLYNNYNVDVSEFENKVKLFDNKIGGWLIIIWVSFFTSIIKSLSVIFSEYESIYFKADLSFAEQGDYILHFFYNLQITLAIFDGLFHIFSISLCFILMNKKRSSFPKILKYSLIAYPIITLIFIIFTSILIRLSNDNLELDLQPQIYEFFRSIVACLIWVSYLNKSQRVKETFINYSEKNKKKFIVIDQFENQNEINSEQQI